MMKKRITAIITIVMMLMTALPGLSTGMAQAAAVAPSAEYVVADFSGGNVPGDVTVKDRNNTSATAIAIDTSASYGGTSALAWTIGSIEPHIILPYSSEWDNYTKFNLRVYTPIANQKVNIIINETAEASSSKDKGYWQKTPLVLDGTWQTLSVNISDLKAKWESTPSNLYILLNATGWGLSVGTKDEFYAGTKTAIKDEKFYIDSVWLSGKTDFGGNMSITGTSIAHGEGNIPANLDGNNTFTMSFSKPLWDTDYSETVKVYDITDGTEAPADTPYQVNVNGNDLDVVFDSELPQGDYKVTLDSKAFWGANGEKLSTDAEYIFSVEKGSVFFLVTSHTIPDGAKDVEPQEGLTYTVTFNNNIDTSGGTDNFVSVTEGDNSLDVNEDYIVDCEGNVLTITLTKMLEGRTDYKIVLSSEICDEYTQYLDEDITYTFTTSRVVTRIGADGVVFDARNENDLADGLLKPGGLTVEITDENALLGDKTLKISYKAGVDKTATISPRLGDITGFTHINYLIYSPKADGEGMRLMIATVKKDPTNDKDTYYLYTGKTDWAGWKVLSIPVSSMPGSREPDKTQVIAHTVNFSGWGDKRTEDGYILVDRIWYTNEEVKPLSLDATEYEYEQAHVPANLGGDNAYTFTFDQNLVDNDYSEYVRVYEYEGSEFVSSSAAFETIVDGNKLNVKFPSGLNNGDTYKLTVDSTGIISENVSFGADVTETVFTVGAASPYFKVTGYGIEENTFTFEFNNEPANADIPDYISFYADGVKQYNAYTFKKDGNKLVLTFADELKKNVEYTLKISESYTDIHGNHITEITEFAFDVGISDVADSVVVFSAGDEEDFNAAIARKDITEETSITNLFPQTAKLSYTAGKDVSKYPFHMEPTDITGMKYMNAWIYSPKATGFPMGIIVYNNMASKKYVYYGVTQDWEGWKLFTIDNSGIGGYSSVETINFNFGGWGTAADVTDNTYILVDEIWFSKDKPRAVELESASVPDGYENAAVSGEVIKFTFNSELNAVQNPEITVTDSNGNVVTDYTVDYSGNTMTMTFGTLVSDTKYNVSINGIIGSQPVSQTEPLVLEFTTASEGVFLGGVDFNYDRVMPSADITATYKISNLSEDKASLKLVLLASDEDNRLLAYESKAFDAVAGNSEADVTMTCPENTKTMLAYVLGSEGRLVSGKYVRVTADGSEEIPASFVSGSSPSVSIDSANINVNVLEVKGSVSALNNAVLVEIGGESMLSSGVVSAGYDGSFEYYYVFPADIVSGSYTVKVMCDGKTDTKEISYVSKTDRNELLSLANGSSSSTLKNALSSLKNALGISDAVDEELEDIASAVIAHDNFDTYSEVADYVARVSDLLDRINSSAWNTLAKIILDNTDILGKDNSDIKYFESIGERGQNRICEILVRKLPADSISGFMDKLSDAIDEYKDILDDEKNNSSSGNGGGGGGGGKASSSAAYPTGSANTTPYTPIEANTVFTDLSEALWATDSVMTLYKEGIVSYPTDGKFRPNDKITREEFVKMVVCAFISNAPYSTHRFADEVENAWYNEYLSKAYSSGITTGYPDGSFGIGENITREDMVTICARTLEALGQNMTSAYDGGFADSASISGYAKGYVGAMTQTGVINGMGDGSFAPKANATRAEAAKVIAGLIELY